MISQHLKLHCSVGKNTTPTSPNSKLLAFDKGDPSPNFVPLRRKCLVRCKDSIVAARYNSLAGPCRSANWFIVLKLCEGTRWKFTERVRQPPGKPGNP